MNASSPRRYRLTLEYDGGGFSGWQKQNDARTVQGDLIKAAERVFGAIPSDLQGCGRTDAGVHALEYVAHLEVKSALSPGVALARLNQELPKDLAVLALEAVHPRFHARHSCIARSYVYQLCTRKSAFGKRYIWWLQEEVDVQAMQRATDYFIGMHDYRAFAERQELKKSTKALIHQVRLFSGEGRLSVRVVGSHFLWHMVRRMVGVMVAVGRGQLAPEDVRILLQEPSELPLAHTAPAAGLFFEKAFYEEEELRKFLSGPQPFMAVTGA